MYIKLSEEFLDINQSEISDFSFELIRIIFLLKLYLFWHTFQELNEKRCRNKSMCMEETSILLICTIEEEHYFDRIDYWWGCV